MKHVLLHSIRHTGTWFVIHLMEAAYGKKKTWITMPGAIRKRLLSKEPNQTLETIIKEDETNLASVFNKHVLRGVTKEEKEKYDLLILHTHYENTKAGMMQSLKKASPGFHIVMPMRDPMLSLCTKIWREFDTLENYKKKKNEKQRKHFATQHIEKFRNVLHVPAPNIFLFPIDTPFVEESEENRIHIYQTLYDFVDLPYSDEALQIVKDWKPVNKTVDCYQKNHESMYHDILRVAVDGHVGKENDGKIFEGIKAQAKNGQNTIMDRFLPIELEILNKNKSLRKRLETIGYKNLAWW